jgi:hypothetical protein
MKDMTTIRTLTYGIAVSEFLQTNGTDTVAVFAAMVVLVVILVTVLIIRIECLLFCLFLMGIVVYSL